MRRDGFDAIDIVSIFIFEFYTMFHTMFDAPVASPGFSFKLPGAYPCFIPLFHTHLVADLEEVDF